MAISTAKSHHTTQGTTIDPEEVARFSAIAAQWWDPNGKFKPLHIINPLRVGYIRQQVMSHFGMAEHNQPEPFKGLRLLDIGCGGGLLSEPMARLGAEVTAIDASEKNIKTASVHAIESGLQIDYRCTTAEALAEEERHFDVVLNMEVIEHVADVALFMEKSSALLKPGGMMVLSTLNRTRKAYALAIVGAEYVLRWLPKGTHSWDKFLTPAEIMQYMQANGLTPDALMGMNMNPLTFRWSLSERDFDVNYLLVGRKL